MADNSLGNIFKQDNLNEVKQAFQTQIKPIVDEFEQKGHISKSTISKQLDGIAGILANVMDAADGKQDKVIHPKEAIKGLEAAMQSQELQNMQSNPQFLQFKRQLEEYKKIADKMPASLNADEVRAQMATSLHGLNNMAFEKLDKNKDGKISQDEFEGRSNANLPKLTGAPAQSSGRGV